MKTKHLLIGAGVLLVAYLAYTRCCKKKMMAAAETKPSETATTTAATDAESGGLASVAGGGIKGAKSGQPIRIDTYRGHVNQGQ